jgi:hypothetical protein
LLARPLGQSSTEAKRRCRAQQRTSRMRCHTQQHTNLMPAPLLPPVPVAGSYVALACQASRTCQALDPGSEVRVSRAHNVGSPRLEDNHVMVWLRDRAHTTAPVLMWKGGGAHAARGWHGHSRVSDFSELGWAGLRHTHHGRRLQLVYPHGRPCRCLQTQTRWLQPHNT